MYDIYRRNGEWVGQVEADNDTEALVKAWRKYFGDPNGVLTVRNDGTLRVIRKTVR